uniref:7TM_GPCR_Srx domain-containing protein n=1 Tax=Caenorhabditis tropicalis TaxID=1561998 RepID=A0A1I7V3D0_9PELO
MLVNQMVSYGIYLLGPVTQLLISINRLMVIVFVKKSIQQNNQKITVAVLIAFWVISIVITGLGARDTCNVIYIPELLNWFSGGCDDNLGEAVMGFVILCAILSNICNLIVVFKLAMTTKKNFLDSESVRRRQAKSKKLFIQSCIQDWLFAIDSLNSTYIDLIYDGVIFRFLLDIFSNLMTPVLDG